MSADACGCLGHMLRPTTSRVETLASVDAQRLARRRTVSGGESLLHDDGARLEDGLLDLLVRQDDDAMQQHLREQDKGQG